MALRASLYALVILLSVGCEDRTRGAETANEATEVTNAHMGEDLPQVALSDMVIETLDMGDRWRVSYSVPGGGTGGPIIFVVNKRSGEIVHMETEQ